MELGNIFELLQKTFTFDDVNQMFSKVLEELEFPFKVSVILVFMN